MKVVLKFSLNCLLTKVLRAPVNQTLFCNFNEQYFPNDLIKTFVLFFHNISK